MAKANVNKTNWTKVAFGEVVRKVADRVDPQKSDIERYIAGEHMDTDDIRIRRWGTVGDSYLGPAFHMRFKPGQVLYGSRRTYLRKVVVPDFVGITANTTFVLEPKNPNVLLPEFLPFIMQTECFHEHSKKQSKGSVNPYINFSDLEWFEFSLPPLEEQRGIVELLGNSEAVLDSLVFAKEKYANLIKRFLIDQFERLRAQYPLQPMDRFGEARLGRQKAPQFQQGKSPRSYIRVANIRSLRIDLSKLEMMDFTAREFERYRLLSGDVLLTEGDLVSEYNVGRPAIFESKVEECCFQNTLIRLRPQPGMDSKFLLLLLEGARLSCVFAEAAKTTTVTHLGLSRFRAVQLPLPPKSVRTAMGKVLTELMDIEQRLDNRLENARNVHRQLLTEVLE